MPVKFQTWCVWALLDSRLHTPTVDLKSIADRPSTISDNQPSLSARHWHSISSSTIRMDPDASIWTADNVKQWATETFPTFGSSLAEALYANDVDGSILLEYVTDDTLKSDLGIKSLGQRVKTLEKITELRKAKGMLIEQPV